MKLNLAEAIEGIRLSMHMSGSDLAKAIKRPKLRLMAIESQLVDPSIEELEAIAEAFNMPVVVLIAVATPAEVLEGLDEERMINLYMDVTGKPIEEK